MPVRTGGRLAWEACDAADADALAMLPLVTGAAANRTGDSEMAERMNPYDPPNTDSRPDAEGEVKPPPKTNLVSLLIPTFIGAVAGAVVLAPFTRSFGAPTGRGVGFGLGGMISMIGALIVRGLWRRLTS